MPYQQFSERGVAAIGRAGELARSGAVGPAHLLAAVLEVSGPLGEMAAVAHAPGAPKGRGRAGPAPERVIHFDSMSRQAVSSAGAWAAKRGTRAGPEDLLVVLVDQHSPSVVAALARMGPDSDRLRQAALRLLGLPDEYGTVALDPLQAAGSADRSALGIEDLPGDAWAALQDRQRRLPVHRVRRGSDWAAVVINEQRAVLKLSARQGLSPDETHSLLHHHRRAVEDVGTEVLPDIARAPAPSPRRLKVAWLRWTAQRY
jgi:hypothetical protein